MSTVIALVLAYFGLVVVLSLLVKPQRERLRTLAHDVRSGELTPRQERVVHHLLGGAYSLRSAPMQLAAAAILILTPSFTLDRDARKWASENESIVRDKRWGEMFDAYLASVAAVNPLFGVLMYAAIWLFRAKAKRFVVRGRSGTAVDQVVADTHTVEIYGELKAI